MFAPLVATMKKEGWAVPEGFNAKAKLVPDWSKAEDQLMEEFGKIEEEMRRRGGRSESGGKKGLKLGEGMEWSRMKEEYLRMVKECNGGVRERMIRKFDERTGGFFVAPADKYCQEMAIM